MRRHSGDYFGHGGGAGWKRARIPVKGKSARQRREEKECAEAHKAWLAEPRVIHRSTRQSAIRRST